MSPTELAAYEADRKKDYDAVKAEGNLDDDEEDEDGQDPTIDEKLINTEYEPEETLFQIRVLYGLGKCADLIFPKSLNDIKYR
jgi:hypothetical protein